MLELKHVHVELLLELLVGIVDAKLLKARNDQKRNNALTTEPQFTTEKNKLGS